MEKRPTRSSRIPRQAVLACAIFLVFALLDTPFVRAQTDVPPTATGAEVPLEHCDKLPVVKVKIGGADVRFLVDTAATSMLNIKSVSA